MPFDLPVIVGPFAIEPSGRIAPAFPEVPPVFSFAWRDRPVSVCMTGGGTPAVVARAELGRVPSTGLLGAAQDMLRLRERLFASLGALTGLMPTGWTALLKADHRLVIEARLPLALPAAISELLTEITLFLLRLEPYLTIAEEDGLAPASLAADGMLKICPG